jgi:hypothetical protein
VVGFEEALDCEFWDVRLNDSLFGVRWLAFAFSSHDIGFGENPWLQTEQIFAWVDRIFIFGYLVSDIQHFMLETQRKHTCWAFFSVLDVHLECLYICIFSNRHVDS